MASILHHPEVGFEHLHLHTDFSPLDGYGTVWEYAKRAREINQRFLCVSDHGMMGVIPHQLKACDKYGVEPLFGCELYVNPMQPECKNDDDYSKFASTLNEKELAMLRKSFHVLAIAYNEIGYANLVQISSWGWIHGLGGRPKRPRVTHEVLQKHKEGIVFSSGCYNSEIAQAFDGFEGFEGEGGDEAAFEMLEKYMAMFGENFYLEIMLLDFNKQKPYNEFLIRAHLKYPHLPIVLTNDCHYCMKQDSDMQRYMLMIQTNKTIREIQEALKVKPDQDFFELQDSNLWMKSEEELNQKWEKDYVDSIDYEIFKAAKENSWKIAEKAKGVKLDRSLKLPHLPDADEKFKEAVIRGFKERALPKTREYLNRVKEEYELITRLNFSSYFLIQKMMTDEARRRAAELFGTDGSEAVGPGRGSGVSSLCNYCLGITDVDPVKHNLLFPRFLSEARCGRKMKLRFRNLSPCQS